MSARLKNQSGNALFLILIAVVLFAALSFAISNSGRTSAGTATREKADIAAAAILNHVMMLDHATTRMQVTKGCTDRQFSFENPIDAGYTNALAPSSKACHYFDPAGGAVPYQMDWFYSGLAFLTSGSTTGDLIAAYPVTLDVCLAINRRFSLPATDASSLAEDYIDNTKFIGTYNNGNRIPDAGGNTVPFQGARDACVKAFANGSSVYAAGTYFYYHVILLRS